MSVSNEIAIDACPQVAPPPAAKPSEGALPPRPRKSAVLGEVARLSLEGHSNREISKKLQIPRQTVDRWLGELRLQWMENAQENAAGLFATSLVRLESIYREAMEAWRRSLADKEVVVEAAGDRNPQSTIVLKKETQSGKAALLGKAIQAAKEICTFKSRHLDRVQQDDLAQRNRRRSDLADDLSNLSKQKRREVIETLKLMPPVDPSALVEQLEALPTEEYRKLRNELWNHYDLTVPYR